MNSTREKFDSERLVFGVRPQQKAERLRTNIVDRGKRDGTKDLNRGGGGAIGGRRSHLKKREGKGGELGFLIGDAVGRKRRTMWVPTEVIRHGVEKCGHRPQRGEGSKEGGLSHELRKKRNQSRGEGRPITPAKGKELG